MPQRDNFGTGRGAGASGPSVWGNSGMNRWDSMERLGTSQEDAARYVPPLAAFVCRRLGPFVWIESALERIDHVHEPSHLSHLRQILRVIEENGQSILAGLAGRAPAPEDVSTLIDLMEQGSEEQRASLRTMESTLRSLPGLLDFLKSDQESVLSHTSMPAVDSRLEVLNLLHECLRKKLGIRERVRVIDALGIHFADDPSLLLGLPPRIKALPQDVIRKTAILNAIGQLYFTIGSPQEAAECFAAAARGSMDARRRGFYLLNRFHAHLQAEQPEEALETFGKALVESIEDCELFDTHAYTAQAILRCGTYGVSFLCEHQTGQRVVVHGLGGGELSGEQVFAEARRLARHTSPYLERVLAWNWADRRIRQAPFLVTDFSAGRTMADLVAEAPLPEEQAVPILTKLAQGMQSAHDLGVIHGDLRPELIVFPEGPMLTPRIVGFGLRPLSVTLHRYWQSKHLGRSRIDAEMLQSLQFSAPEQRGEIDETLAPATDVFSWGRLGFLLLTGEAQPDRSDDAVSGNVSERLWDILELCTLQHPVQRYQSFDELIETLENLGEAELDEQAGGGWEMRLAATPLTPVEELWWEPGEGQTGCAELHSVPLAAKNTLGMELVLVPPGRFVMGAPQTDPDRAHDEHEHEVELTRPFLMKAAPVSQDEWKGIMDHNPSHFQAVGEASVERVSWFEAVEFCNKLSEIEGLEPVYEIQGEDVLLLGLDRSGYRLPTESEWEFACRAGTKTQFSTGERLGEEEANFGIIVGHPAPIKFYPANPWGLYDLHGNVWEWCWDWYGPYPEGLVHDPAGPETGSERVARGGSWGMTAKLCASSVRDKSGPSVHGNDLGFRFVRTVLTLPEAANP